MSARFREILVGACIAFSIGAAGAAEARLGKAAPASRRKPASACARVAWPFDREATRKDIKVLLERRPREHGYQYLFGELTRSRENNALANALWFYLVNTEADPERQGFLHAVGEATGIRDPKSPARVVDFNELCDLFSLAQRP